MGLAVEARLGTSRQRLGPPPRVALS